MGVVVPDQEASDVAAFFAEAQSAEGPLTWWQWVFELTEVLARLKMGRASGLDQVPAEV